jgi:predicted metal-dependent phosphoesterase TrpH
VLSGRFEPGQQRRYRHVPFDVPAGVWQLHVCYDYTDRISSDPLLQGGNTLDIGLFDQRGIAAGSPGFRGWSGSNKLNFTVDREWATPPYLPGPLGAGTWHLLLGPYKIGPRGLDYRVELWFNAGLPFETRSPLPAGLPATEWNAVQFPAAAEGWLRGELHCHTLYSDGDSWPADVVVAAAEAGLDFVAITDHNSVGAHLAPDALPAGSGWPVVIRGVEVTTYRGHWNVWGTSRWFEFREPTEATVSAAMAEAVEAGGLVSVSHPKPLGPPWEYATTDGYHAIEVWNGPWQRLNEAALVHWETHLRQGKRIVAVGGSDTHHLRPKAGTLLPPRIGRPTNWIRIDGHGQHALGHEKPTAEALVQALRRGDGFISASPAGPQVYLSPSRGGVHIRVAGAAGMALLLAGRQGCLAAHAIGSDDWDQEFSLPGGQSYIRAQVVDAAGAVQALTNPIWL